MRVARHIVPGSIYHVIWRFVDHEFFIAGREHRTTYLRLLGRALAESDWRLLSFAVMSNHLHHALIAGRQPLASWCMRVHTPYAQWINMGRNRIGAVFIRGPKAYAVEPSYVAYLLAYIHNNPVRARVVSSARRSRWTSHSAYVGDVEPPPWLHVNEGLALAGLTAQQLDPWVRATPGDKWHVELEKIRSEARRRGSLEVATPTVGARTTVPLVMRPHGHVRPDPRLFVRFTAEHLAISHEALCSRRRDQAVVAGRRIAVHAAVAYGVAKADIASALAISGAAVTLIARAPLAPELVAIREDVLACVAALGW